MVTLPDFVSASEKSSCPPAPGVGVAWAQEADSMVAWKVRPRCGITGHSAFPLPV